MQPISSTCHCARPSSDYHTSLPTNFLAGSSGGDPTATVAANHALAVECGPKGACPVLTLVIYAARGNALGGVRTNEAVEIAMNVVRPFVRPSVGRVLSEPKKSTPILKSL